MQAKLTSLLNIEKNETLSVSLLILQSLFIGIFNGTFYISSHTLFIGSYGGESIPMAYLISGGVGIILTLIYSQLQEKIKFANLSKINLIFVAVITGALAFSYSFITKKHVDFAQFVLFGPLFILSIVSFWGVANRLYNLRQGKRLFGIIDAGMIFGIIISSISIPLIPYITGYEINYENLLFVSLICTVITCIVQFVISSKFNLDKVIEKNESDEKVESSIKILFKNKYVIMMATFVGLSVLVAFFVQYSFMLVLEKKYTNEEDLGAFLGIFTTALMIFTFLIKAFVYSKLIKNYGLKICLIILPFLLAAFTLAAIIIGYAMGVEDVSSSGFLFFFMLIALSKLIAQSLKEGIELPSFKLIYQTLNEKIRHRIQAQIDGSVNEFSALFSGLCLVGLSALSFIEITELSVVMIVIILIWLYVAYKLYASYKKSLESGLKIDLQQQNTNLIKPLSESLLTKILSSKKISKPNLFLSLNAIDPILFEKNLSQFIVLGSKELEAYFINDVCKYPNIIHKEILQEIQKNSPQYNNEASNLIANIDSHFKDIDYQKIAGLSNSKLTEERILATHLIRHNYDPKYDTILLRLIKDPNLDVKSEVIKACAILNKTDFSPIIIEYLADDELYSVSYSALKEFGEHALEFINHSYYKSNVSYQSLVAVTELLSYINTKESNDLLFEKIFSKNRLIMQKATVGIQAKNLSSNTEKGSLELLNLLNEQISIVAWNIAALNAFTSEYPEMETTISAIEDDISFSKEILFSLLSIVFDSNSVQIVINNLNSGNPDNISYGIEMLELFVHEHLKPILFPVLDDSNLTEKVSILEDYFPIEVFRTDSPFNQILNRDSNFLSDWTKATLIYEMDLSNVEITNVILAHLFNPNKIISETTHYKLSQIKSKAREDILLRFTDSEKIVIEKEITRLVDNKENLMVNLLLNFKKVVNNNSLRPMNWITEIPYIKAHIIDSENLNLSSDKNVIYLINEGDNGSNKCYILNKAYNEIKVSVNDKIVSINKSVHNKIASNKGLTDFLLLNESY